MCQKRNSVIAELPIKKIRCDKCIRNLIESMNVYGYNTVACCCGHGKYPLTIVCKTRTGKYYDVVSGKSIQRIRNFYRLDSEGYYYIPEVNKLAHQGFKEK